MCCVCVTKCLNYKKLLGWTIQFYFSLNLLKKGCVIPVYQMYHWGRRITLFLALTMTVLAKCVWLNIHCIIFNWTTPISGTRTHIYSTYICTLTFPTFHGLRFHFRFKLLYLFSIGLKLLNNKCATCRWTLWRENELLQTWNGYKSIAMLHIYSLSFITHLWFTVYSLRWSGVPSRVYSCFMPSVPGRDSRSTNGPDQDKVVTEEVLFSILFILNF